MAEMSASASTAADTCRRCRHFVRGSPYRNCRDDHYYHGDHDDSCPYLKIVILVIILDTNADIVMIVIIIIVITIITTLSLSLLLVLLFCSALEILD